MPQSQLPALIGGESGPPRLGLMVVVAALAVAACASTPALRPKSQLAGTSWQLQAIQSMEDAQGTTRISDPARFTLHFDASGRTSLRLDCNRGTGTWQAVAAGDSSGSLKFGPIAATRALCHPPNLDERVVRDLGYVRGYLLRDGKLYLSLMADGGIYQWAPVPHDDTK